MTSISTAPGNFPIDKACVKVTRPYVVGIPVLTNPQTVRVPYTNSLSQTFFAEYSVPAPHTLSIVGPTVQVNAVNAAPVPISILLSPKFSGRAILTVNSMDLVLPATEQDRLCSASIGLPNSTVNGQIVSDCLMSLPGVGTSKIFTWDRVEANDLITFIWSHLNNFGTLAFLFDFVLDEYQQWESINRNGVIHYRDPSTNLIYRVLPTGVVIASCEDALNDDDSQYISWDQILESDVYPIAWSFATGLFNSPQGVAIDPVRYANIRTDGIGTLNGIVIGPFRGRKFHPAGTALYSLSVTAINVQPYNINNQILTSNFNIPIVLTANYGGTFNPRAFAIDPTNKRDPVGYAIDQNVALNTVFLSKVQLQSGLVSYAGWGNTNLQHTPSTPTDSYHLEFTKSGQLLLAHQDAIYLVDKLTGNVDIDNPILIPRFSTSTSPFLIQAMSRFENGDILVTGLLNGATISGLILDGDSYQWKPNYGIYSSFASTTPLTTTSTLAYPGPTKIIFKRVFTKNMETGAVSSEDRSIYDGNRLALPVGALIREVIPVSSVTWTQQLAYQDNNLPDPVGTLTVAAGSVMSTITGCRSIVGFVAPASTLNRSLTHSVDSNILFGLANPNNLERYTWTTKTTPAFISSAPITGFVAGDILSDIRTRWRDGTLWMLGRDAVDFNLYRFYIINLTTNVAVLQASFDFPDVPPAGTDASFTWGLDDELYFTARSFTSGQYKLWRISKDNFQAERILTSLAPQLTVGSVSTDVTDGTLIINIRDSFGNSTVYTYDTEGNFLAECGSIVGARFDVIMAPSTGVRFGTGAKTFVRQFARDNNTGEITFSNHDISTGKDIVLPPGAIVTPSQGSVAERNQPPLRIRYRNVTAALTWVKSIDAPRARRITIRRIAGTVNIVDAVLGSQAIVVAEPITFQDTRDASRPLANDLTVVFAAGATGYISWEEEV